MKFFIVSLLMLLQQQQAAEPTISVLRGEDVTLSPGEALSVTVVVDPGSELSGRQVKLLPLALENLEAASIISRTEKTAFNNEIRLLHYFDIRLEAVEAGKAVVGEFQVEMSGMDDAEASSQPLLYTQPGFSLEVVQPIDWQGAGFWILIIAVLLGTGLFIFIRFKQAAALKAPAERSEKEERRSRKIRDLEELIIRTEWKKAVDLAYTELLRESAFQGGSGEPVAHRLDDDRIAAVSQTWPDFAAAYRLGEEVRYGGFIPSRREAAFMVKSLKEIYSKPFEPETEEDKEKHE